MSSNQNKLSRFWQELKRRRVLHVITVYASAAFVIIELIGNLTEPLNLPASLSTIIIIVLAVGFPLAIILSWLYDLTSGSFTRTKPLEDIPDEQEVKVPNAWKIATYVSFVVIAGLIVLNIAARSDLIKPGMIQSLVVLPFDNYTGDEQFDYVASGMHASLIGDIGKVSALRVIGETSSNVYKETDKSAPDIAKELNVDLVLEPTLTCYGDTVCILVRAIAHFPEEKQIWVAEYSEDKSKILSLWNRITKQIAEQVKVELTPEEERLLAKSVLVDRDAIDAYLSSYAHWDDLNEESVRKAIEYLNDAVEKEQGWAPLYTGLAQLWGILVQIGAEPAQTGMPKVFGYLDKAMELDPDFADLHFNKACFGVWLEWDWEKGEKEFLEALAINPSDVMSRIYYAHLLGILQRNEEAQLQGRIAVELEPLDPLIHGLYAAVCAFTKNWEAAMEHIDKALALDPDHWFALQLSDMVAFHLGDYDRVLQAWEDFLPFPVTFFDSIQTLYRDQGIYAAYERVVQEMINTGYGTPVDYAARFSYLHQYDKALEWLEIGYEVHDPNMPYITTGFYVLDSLYKDHRFLSIIEKMDLPLPESY